MQLWLLPLRAVVMTTTEFLASLVANKATGAWMCGARALVAACTLILFVRPDRPLRQAQLRRNS